MGESVNHLQPDLSLICDSDTRNSGPIFDAMADKLEGMSIIF